MIHHLHRVRRWPVGRSRGIPQRGIVSLWFLVSCTYPASSPPKPASSPSSDAVSLAVAIVWSRHSSTFHHADWEHLRDFSHRHCRRWLVWVSCSPRRAIHRHTTVELLIDSSRFDISSMSAIIGTWQYKCYFNQGPTPATHEDCTGPRSSVQGGITASMAGGSWVGALLSGFLSDMLGRKKAIMVGSVIWYVLSHRLAMSLD